MCSFSKELHSMALTLTSTILTDRSRAPPSWSQTNSAPWWVSAMGCFTWCEPLGRTFPHHLDKRGSHKWNWFWGLVQFSCRFFTTWDWWVVYSLYYSRTWLMVGVFYGTLINVWNKKINFALDGSDPARFLTCWYCTPGYQNDQEKCNML